MVTNVSRFIHSRMRLARFTLVYAGMSVVWLVLSTPLSSTGPQHPRLLAGLSILYYVVSALILTWIWLRQEKTIQQSQHEYDHLLNTLTEPVIIHRQGIILDANGYALKLFEATDKQQVVGRSVYDFVHADHVGHVRHRVAQLTSGRATDPTEQKLITLSGAVRHAEILAIPTTHGGHPAIQTLMRDITERKQYEATLFEREQRLRTLINAIPDQICLIDRSGRWIEANDPLLNAVGLPPDSYRGKTAQELAARCDPRYQVEFLNNSPYDESTFLSTTTLHYERNLPDGSFGAADITRVPVRAEDGTPTGLVIVARSVSEQRNTMRKLEQSEQRYRQLIESARDAMFVTVHEQIEFVNEAAVALIGASSKAELVGQPIARFVNVAHHVAHGEFKVHRLDHQTVEVEAHCSDIEFMDQTASLLVLRDITERKQSDELLIRSEKLATAGQLAAGIAHEIRNPLTSLKGFLHLIKRNANESEQYYCDIMNGELQRIEEIVNEFLVLAKATVMQMKAHPLEELVSETIGLLTAESDLRAIHLTASMEPRIPMVLCDRNRLKQVFVNIIKNALEAVSDNGTVQVRVGMEADEAVIVSVTDNGVGIPADQLPRVGEPFFTTKASGTGLGLMVTHKIIESHGGLLQIQSEIGKGTEVRIVLPAAYSNIAVGQL